ncbi:MAG TPA: hypothetical protein VMB50_20885 [Myxococcales bacterium]|nr:hypothetical protein [Myxococcales bacterium]
MPSGYAGQQGGSAQVAGAPAPSSPAQWAASTVKGTGAQVYPKAAPNGLYYYNAGSSGTTGSSEPSPWPLVPGGTVVDGTVTWTCAGDLPMAGVAPTIQEPVGSDAPTAAAIDVPLSMGADWLAFLAKQGASWGYIETDGAGNASLEAGADVASVSISGLAVVVNFAKGFSSNYYGALVIATSAGSSAFGSYSASSGTQADLSMWSRSALTQIDLATTAMGIFFVAFGPRS